MTRDEAIAQGKAALDQATGDAFGVVFDAGVSSVVIPEPAPVLGSDASEQEKIDAAVKQAVDARAQADDAAMKTVQDELAKVQSDLDKATSDDASDKAAIAAKQEMLDKISAILAPVVAPVQA